MAGTVPEFRLEPQLCPSCLLLVAVFWNTAQLYKWGGTHQYTSQFWFVYIYYCEGVIKIKIVGMVTKN